MRTLIPTHLVFNGAVGALTGENARQAKVGETVLMIHNQANRDSRPHLIGGHGNYVWAINNQLFPDAEPLEVRKGEWVRLNLQNRSMMAHPMHLHGHFFQVRNGTGRGPFKDTVTVGTHGDLSVDFVADNPGDWLFHCHNAYHLATGMARVISYTS